MSLIDFILNLAGLLLWLNWRAGSLDQFGRGAPATLAGAIRRAEPSKARRWPFLVALALLLLLRGFLYWQIGPTVDWVPNLRLGAIALYFRSDQVGRMLLFSVTSFLFVLAIFHIWLLLLSLVNGRTADADPVQRLVRVQLGAVDRWPWPIKLLLPILVVTMLWLMLHPLLAPLTDVRPTASAAQRLEQGAIIALGAYLSWKYLIGGLLLFCLLTTYIYLGEHPIWGFVALTGRNLLRPLRYLPLQIGRVDLAPVLGIAIVFFGARFGEQGLTLLYQRLAL